MMYKKKKKVDSPVFKNKTLTKMCETSKYLMASELRTSERAFQRWRVTRGSAFRQSFQFLLHVLHKRWEVLVHQA